MAQRGAAFSRAKEAFSVDGLSSQLRLNKEVIYVSLFINTLENEPVSNLVIPMNTMYKKVYWYGKDQVVVLLVLYNYVSWYFFSVTANSYVTNIKNMGLTTEEYANAYFIYTIKSTSGNTTTRGQIRHNKRNNEVSAVSSTITSVHSWN